VALALVAGIVSGGATGFAVSTVLREETPAVSNTDPGGSDVDTASDVRIDESSAIIDAVDSVAPAVVTIQAQTDAGLAGTGSGFIFDADGWILTNRHVVEDSSELVAVLEDGRQFDATVYGVDTLTDLAILKVETDGDLPVAPLGTSADLEPGQLAIAIGNPQGQYPGAVTTGVVSGLGRRIQAGDATESSAEQLSNLIQTDAAINPGNSGGPLVNSAGQVIGVNTAVSTSAQGIGFAIPIDIAKPILAQALNGEELTRPWIGVYYQLITPGLAEQEDLPVDEGALIGSGTPGTPAVFPDSPAAQAGLQEGDIVVAVDGERIDTESDLSSFLLPHAPGDTVTLTIVRNGEEQDVDVTLAELPANR
jgi:2-alkenal reductase